jgi:hypothetical protein
MMGPLGVLAAGPTTGTIEVEDVDGGALRVLMAGPAAATTEVENIDGGPLGGAGAGDPEAPTTNGKKHRRRVSGRCRS